MEQMLEDVKNGDKDAFTNFILQNEQKYYKVARTIVHNDDDIADSLQNTLIYAYKNIKKVKDMKFFNTWIIKILINECKKTYNRNKKIHYLDDEKELPDEKSTLGEEDSDFYIIINNLEKKDRQIFVLHYMYGLTTKEIRESA
ncbi:MAG: sigma-70 family RNA polymerase sigma factor [Lachnospiraceae bacterium]|jgi:RNA polymerase sigma-70 factor (ECF subfamily)|nr:sigma-70 family RNA polymerase sigma factor [Lachnospiraceae bacterium]